MEGLAAAVWKHLRNTRDVDLLCVNNVKEKRSASQRDSRNSAEKALMRA
jgi:hypothetical protein